MSASCDSLPIPSADQVRADYAARDGYDYVVPGGGHGAAAVCRAFVDAGHHVAGVANPIDEGGHSARIRWNLYRRLGYWTIIPGDTMNLLGGGFAHPAVYGVTNSRLPKDLGDTPADAVFGEAVDRMLAKAKEADRPALERFRQFVVAMGECAQKELVETGVASLAGASFQNVLHAAVMVHVGAYREGLSAVDQEQYLVGSYLLEQAMGVGAHGSVLPMSFDKVTLVTKHAGSRTVVGGINRVLLAKGALDGLYYGELVPNAMLADAAEESLEAEQRKLAAAKVVDWHAAEVHHGPLSEEFNNDWVFEEVRPLRPRMNPRLTEVLRALKPGGSLIVPPGNCHESTYTFFLLDGVAEEIMQAKARGVRVTLVCNPVNLLFSAGYTVHDYLASIEQALAHATGGRRVPIEQIVDRVVVNDPTRASASVQKMMRGEDIPPQVKQELLHRTPTGPVEVSPEQVRALEAKGLEVVVKDMLEVQKISIRGLEAESVSYERHKLREAITS